MFGRKKKPEIIKPKYVRIKICKYCQSSNIDFLRVSNLLVCYVNYGDYYAYLCLDCGRITTYNQFERKEVVEQ